MGRNFAKKVLDISNHTMLLRIQTAQALVPALGAIV